MRNLFNEQVGLLKNATITGYDAARGILKTQLNAVSSIGGSQKIDIPLPASFFSNNGIFAGSLPTVGTAIIIGQGSSGDHYFVSYLTNSLPNIPEVDEGEYLVRTNDKTIMRLDLNNNIDIGSTSKKIHIDTNSKLITFNFDSENHFTEGSRQVNGIVKRDLHYNVNYAESSKLESDDYDKNYSIISLDPYSSPNPVITSSKKNPPFVEKREIVYEFQYSSDIADDLTESSLYTSSPNESKNYTFPNRRLSRADTLSLTTLSPNYLMETVKGTVVDIFGNILDLNRNPLPIGQGDNTLRSDDSADKKKSFLSIKELQRKSLAYHFEINTKKDFYKDGKLVLPDINSNEDSARNRSRFSLDIDKEGQLKFNVPASSEKGNIPLLTRYENYSSFGDEDNGNPNKLIYRNDNLDIFQDSFAKSPVDFKGDGPNEDKTIKGSIALKDGDADGAPIDRILNTHIKHGTAYHDILQTCYIQQKNDFLDYQNADLEDQIIKLADLPLLTDVVSSTIKVSGSDANAGGRSGSINFDGSLELNIGANTVDRQSLWLDTAGGIVTNIGRDRNNRSLVSSLNGDVLVQVGGIGVVGDSRFEKLNNGQMGAVVDLRVFTNGLFAHLIRLDEKGISIMTPGDMNFYAKGNMKFTSDSEMIFEAEGMTVLKRPVKKENGGSI